jgi:hypothetical protein
MRFAHDTYRTMLLQINTHDFVTNAKQPVCQQVR